MTAMLQKRNIKKAALRYIPPSTTFGINTQKRSTLISVRRNGWYVYYKFKNRFLTNLKFSIETIQGTKWINKDIDYGYSMTVHKTQGSTFDNVAIDLTDIVFQNTRFGRRENDIDIRNKLMYVALSRARKSVIMKY